MNTIAMESAGKKPKESHNMLPILNYAQRSEVAIALYL